MAHSDSSTACYICTLRRGHLKAPGVVPGPPTRRSPEEAFPLVLFSTAQPQFSRTEKMGVAIIGPLRGPMIATPIFLMQENCGCAVEKSTRGTATPSWRNDSRPPQGAANRATSSTAPSLDPPQAALRGCPHFLCERKLRFYLWKRAPGGRLPLDSFGREVPGLLWRLGKIPALGANVA